MVVVGIERGSIDTSIKQKNKKIIFLLLNICSNQEQEPGTGRANKLHT